MKTTLASLALAVAGSRPLLRDVSVESSSNALSEFQPRTEASSASPEFDEVIRELRVSIRHARATARWLFAAAAAVAVVIVTVVPILTTHAVDAIAHSPNTPFVFAYEMLRGTGVIVALLAILGWLVNLGRGSLDQATRF